MSILNEGRYKGNLAWVGQLLHNDGFQALADWIKTIPQADKEDVRFMLELLAREVAKLSVSPPSANDNTIGVVKSPKEKAPGMKGLVQAENVIRMKPKLRLVKPPVDPKSPKKS
jgi:hypothetical protein